MKIYTRTGDEGDTGLFGGGRVAKSHPRVAAFGDVDEVNAALGCAVAAVSDRVLSKRLSLLQHDLFAIGSHLAAPTPAPGRTRPVLPELPLGRIALMETWMDEADETLSPLREFILPGGSAGAAALHLARTVCRRAERSVVALAEDEDVPEGAIRYLNRLSDLLFVFARIENAGRGQPDVAWRKEAAPAAPPSGAE